MLDPLFNSPTMGHLLTLPWFQFLFIIIISALASTKVTLQGAACRRHIRNPQDSLMFNAMFFTSVAIFLSMTLNMRIPNAEILIWAAVMAIGTVMFQVVYSVALTEGPVSITVLIINFAVVIPTAVSAVVFKENIFVSQLLGIACLLISFPLSMKESTGGEKAINKKWVILTAITLITNSAIMTIQKMFHITESYSEAPDTSSNTFLLFIYIFGAAFALAVYFAKSRMNPEEKRSFKFGKSVVFFALAMGLDLAVYQKFYMTANMQIPGSFFFPTFSGLQSFLMTVIGILLFKDRLNRRQLVGVMFGILAVILLNIQFGVSFVIG